MIFFDEAAPVMLWNKWSKSSFFSQESKTCFMRRKMNEFQFEIGTKL